MPFPIALAVPFVTAGIKGLIGAFAKKPKLPKVEVPGAVKEATNLARTQAGQTVAPGYSTHLESLRKMGADAIAQAKRTVKDPSQLQTIMGQINNMMAKGASDLRGMNEKYRVQALNNLQQQLNVLGQHKVRVQDENVRRKQQEYAARANLFGSAFRDINTGANQIMMNKSMEDYMSTINNLYGGGGGNEYGLPSGTPL
jgi:hypothetical protein